MNAVWTRCLDYLEARIDDAAAGAERDLRGRRHSFSGRRLATA